MHKQLKKAFSKFGGNLNPKIISFRMAYWRKANAIHGWFVKNVQNGQDDCKEYFVDREKLRELYNLCKQILDEPDPDRQNELANEQLPPQEGFFFGEAKIDEGYFADLRDTMEQLEPLIGPVRQFAEELKGEPDPDDIINNLEFYYHSSW
jgi:hypothetical protein